MTVRSMTQGSPVKLIFAVALPLMLGNVFQQLYTVVDAQVVGSVEGVSALAALGASDWFNWMFVGLIQGLAQGFTIPMAQAFGAQDHSYLRRCVGCSIVLAVISSVIITGAALLTIDPVLSMLDTPPEIRGTSALYLTILFSAFPIVMAYNLMAGILRSLGDGRSPLWAMVIACAVNISLDLLFVAVFRWGVAGAAAATVIAQMFSAAFCLLRLGRIEFIRPAAADFKPDRKVALHLIRLGLPVSAQNGIIAVGGMIIQSIVNAMGVSFIAGYTATNKLYGVLEIAAISYGYAMSAYAGQNLGAGEFGRIRRGLRSAAVTGVLTAGVIAGAMFLFGRFIVGSFISGTPEEVSQATGVACEFLYLMSAFLPILYILHVYRSALQGMGNTVMPMVSGVAEFIMRTGSALLLPGVIGYKGVFWAEILAWIGADIILKSSFYVVFSKLRSSRAGIVAE